MGQIPSFFVSFIENLYETAVLFLADDPTLRFMQVLFVLFASLLVFLIFFVTRDILQRSNSFLYMFFCIVLVALFPVIGFFLYLLVRPSQTLYESDVERRLIHMQATIDRLQDKIDEFEALPQQLAPTDKESKSTKKRSTKKKTRSSVKKKTA